MAANFSPRFVKGSVRFIYEGVTHFAGEHLLNPFGVPGFKWEVFEPMDTAGKPCRVSVTLSTHTPFEFSCDGFFTCEETGKGTSLGISFLLAENDTQKLNAIIEKEGTLPEYARKFPRIMFLDHIGVMPSRVILRQKLGDEVTDVVCDTVDVSPTGIQVMTEDMRLALAIPGENWDVIMQPRGAFAIPVKFKAEIKRIIHSMDPKSKNARRYLSMSVNEIEGEQKTLFTDLLRQVVTRIRQ